MNQYTMEYKGYYIKPSKEAPYCYVCVTVGKGGKIPDCLSGMFTNRSLIKEKIDWYQEQKGQVNEKDNKGGSQ